MTHKDILDFVPLHLSALERDGGTNLLGWIRGWCEDSSTKLIVLREEDWFIRAHDIVGYGVGESHIKEPIYQTGCYLWAPAPALAELACEELRKSRNKRQDSSHIFVCPRLMTPAWRRHLH